jgi:hypothetical protein
MPKRLPPRPAPQALVPSTRHPVWPQLPPNRRQPWPERLAQRRMHVSHSAPSAAGSHAPQAARHPSPT